VFGTLHPVIPKSGKVKMKAENYHFLRLPDIIDNINSNHYNLTPVHRELLLSLLTLANADRGELSATLSLSPVTDSSRARVPHQTESSKSCPIALFSVSTSISALPSLIFLRLPRPNFSKLSVERLYLYFPHRPIFLCWRLQSPTSFLI
jgi:hypothetical protein